MDGFGLNLSTRPFPAYQLKTIALTIALIALIVVSAFQAYGFLTYSKLASEIRGEAEAADVEMKTLTKLTSEMDARLNQPEAKSKIKEIEFLNSIIVRKTFSWTRLFSAFEELMPPGAHLTSLRPTFEPGQPVSLQVEAQAHAMSDIQELLQAMQSSPLFDDVIVTTGEKGNSGANTGNAMPAGPASGDIKLSFSAKYHPEREEQ